MPVCAIVLVFVTVRISLSDTPLSVSQRLFVSSPLRVVPFLAARGVDQKWPLF